MRARKVFENIKDENTIKQISIWAIQNLNQWFNRKEFESIIQKAEAQKDFEIYIKDTRKFVYNNIDIFLNLICENEQERIFVKENKKDIVNNVINILIPQNIEGEEWKRPKTIIRDFSKMNKHDLEKEINNALDTNDFDTLRKIQPYVKESSQIKEDAMGGVSTPGATLNNVPGIGNAVPPSPNGRGSGDNWNNSISKKPYTQANKPNLKMTKKKKIVKKKKKLVKETISENNISPYDKLGVSMAKKLNIKLPFKKKKEKGNQNAITQQKFEHQIVTLEDFMNENVAL